MTLRRRLTVVLGVLLILGLAVSGVVVYTSVRSYLYGRLDAQLDAAQEQAYHYLSYVHDHGLPVVANQPANTATSKTSATGARVALPASSGTTAGTAAGRLSIVERGLAGRLSPSVYVMLLDHRGKVLVTSPSGSDSNPDPVPLVPAEIPVQSGPPHHIFGRDAGVYRAGSNSFGMAVAGQRADLYRAQAIEVPQGTLIVAIPVSSTVATLRSLVRVEVAASLAVVLVGCALAWWVVRRELKPLEEMTQTAGAIAGGELSRRVPTGKKTSEVGRLGWALNGMLSQIQIAFEDKSRSEEQLRQFAADASHELRTPLTSIRGYTELLRKGALPDAEARDRALGRVESEAERMGALVDDLLLLTRLDRGRPLERVPVDLERIGGEAVEDARAVAPARSITFSSERPVVVNGDPDRLRQVLHNLVRNALEHTPAGTPVSVEVRAEGDWGRCRVTDRGPGMTSAQAAHVFDRFYRADAARTGGGSGLGLSIVRAIAEALGGTATVDTAPGRGAVFTIELPLVETAMGDHPSKGAPPASKGSLTASPLRRRRERGGGRRPSTEEPIPTPPR